MFSVSGKALQYPKFFSQAWEKKMERGEGKIPEVLYDPFQKGRDLEQPASPHFS